MTVKKNRNILRTMLSVSGIVVLAKILGFVKQMITANAFGATIHTDIIAISEGLVANLDYLLVQALATAFIPTYISAKAEGEGKSRRFVSNTITVTFLFSAVIAVIVILASNQISYLLAPTYNAENSAWLAKYLRIFAPVLILVVELAVFNALLKANEVFMPGEMIGFNQSVILIILVLTVGSKLGPDTLVVAFYAYALFNLLYLMWHSRKQWALCKSNPFQDPFVKKLMVMTGPLLLGFAMIFINQQIDKIIVSGLGEGTVTAMSYAAVLSNFISTFIGSICGVLFTYITQNIVERKDKEAADLTLRAALQIGTILLPISIITVACAKDIVTIVFGRGKFDTVAVKSCSSALIGYGFMFVPYVVRELFSRFQYAYGESKRPTINSIISIIFNIGFSILLSRFIGVLGVTLATSVSVLICAILNVVSSVKRNPYFSGALITKHAPRWTAGSILCIVVTLLGEYLLRNLDVLFRFLITAIAGMSVYVIVAWPIIRLLLANLLKKKTE